LNFESAASERRERKNQRWRGQRVGTCRTFDVPCDVPRAPERCEPLTRPGTAQPARESELVGESFGARGLRELGAALLA